MVGDIIVVTWSRNGCVSILGNKHDYEISSHSLYLRNISESWHNFPWLISQMPHQWIMSRLLLTLYTICQEPLPCMLAGNCLVFNWFSVTTTCECEYIHLVCSILDAAQCWLSDKNESKKYTDLHQSWTRTPHYTYTCMSHISRYDRSGHEYVVD